MMYLKKSVILLSLCLLGLVGQVSEAAPVISAPGSDSGDGYLYVFGPGGNPAAGKEDCLQVVFFEFPASLDSVEIFVYHPGSGARFERSSLLGFWRTTVTQFSVYGGEGAFSAPESQSVRPTPQQPGKRLASETYGRNDDLAWVSLGTFSARDAEVIGDTAYLKLVVEGVDGSSANLFKVGANHSSVKIFAYDLTLNLPPEPGSQLRFRVPLHEGVTEILESNFDMDDTNVAVLAGQRLKSSGDGEWVDNRVGVSGTEVVYSISSGDQGYSNAGFHLTDGQGRPLRAYFMPTVVPRKLEAGAGTIDTTLVNLVKQMPYRAAVGEEFAVTLTLTAKESIGNVQVIDTLPQGLELVSATPEPQRSGASLAWQFEHMNPGDREVIQMTVRATEATTYENCVTVTAEPRACTTTVVGQPTLEIAKAGPANAQIGGTVQYQITVRNTGNYTARNVVVNDVVPEGLTHASGQKELKFEIGNLEAGQSRTVAIDLRAERRGRVCNVATVVSSNAAEARAEACTMINEARLEVTKVGPAEQYIGRQATYSLQVNNPGDVTLTNVVVVDTIPRNTQLVSAPGASVDGNRLTWRFAELPAGEAIEGLQVTIVSRETGNLTNTVTVATAEGLRGAAEATTLWRGYPALLIELIDTIDPLQPGEHTDYVITVTNQGTALDRNIRIKATFPPETKPVSGSGHTEATLAGQVVTMAPYAVLQPKQVISWTIRAEAVKPGDSRLRVELTSDLLQTPVTVEESTQVY